MRSRFTLMFLLLVAVLAVGCSSSNTVAQGEPIEPRELPLPSETAAPDSSSSDLQRIEAIVEADGRDVADAMGLRPHELPLWIIFDERERTSFADLLGDQGSEHWESVMAVDLADAFVVGASLDMCRPEDIYLEVHEDDLWHVGIDSGTDCGQANYTVSVFEVPRDLGFDAASPPTIRNVERTGWNDDE